MAAPSRHTERASSSSDDEELQRCRDAVWETRADQRKDGDGVRPSKRVAVAEHGHDGNQLQVTRGFQTHVAQKLEHFLDSCVSELRSETSHSLEWTDCAREDQDEGFRLFSTSIPGQKADRPPSPVRRRPAPSSSDSDGEMETRLKEAAVSLKDLLPSSARPSTPPTDTPSSEEMLTNKVEREKEQDDEEGEPSAGSAPDQSAGAQDTHMSKSSERKKRSRRKLRAEFL